MLFFMNILEIANYEWNEKVVKKLYTQPNVKGIDETIDAIISRKASIARYGDGEFDIIFGRTEGFQERLVVIFSA